MSLICTLAPASRADAATIALLSRNLVEYGLPWRWTPQRIRRCVTDSEYIVLSARQGHSHNLSDNQSHNNNQGMVGFGVMQYLTNRAHLCLLGVVPGIRRQGIGAEMLKWLEKSAVVAGVFDVTLEVRSGNRGAEAFYLRQGYVRQKKIRHYYSRGEHALRMTHNLRVGDS